MKRPGAHHVEDIPWCMACNMPHTQSQCGIARAMEETEDIYASCIEDEFEPSHMVNMVTFGGNNESRYSSS